MHSSQEELTARLEQAKHSVKIGTLYVHYKHPDQSYRVINLAINEADEEVSVIYEAQYGERIVFVRPFSSWTEKIELGDTLIARFVPVGKE